MPLPERRTTQAKLVSFALATLLLASFANWAHEPYFEEPLAKLQVGVLQRGPRSAFLVNAWAHMATVYYRQGRYAESADAMFQLTGLCKDVYGSTDKRYLAALYNTLVVDATGYSNLTDAQRSDILEQAAAALKLQDKSALLFTWKDAVAIGLGNLYNSATPKNGQKIDYASYSYKVGETFYYQGNLWRKIHMYDRSADAYLKAIDQFVDSVKCPTHKYVNDAFTDSQQHAIWCQLERSCQHLSELRGKRDLALRSYDKALALEGIVKGDADPIRCNVYREPSRSESRSMIIHEMKQSYEKLKAQSTE